MPLWRVDRSRLPSKKRCARRGTGANFTKRQGAMLIIRIRAWLLSLLLLLCLPFSARAQAPWTGIIAPSRAVDWSNAGVPGGIPARTTICATIAPYGSSESPAEPTKINQAIAACPSGHAVFLSPGTFYLSKGITFIGHSHVTLRGAGANETFIVFTGLDPCWGVPATVCLPSSDLNYWGSPANLANWMAGYSRGTTSITLSSVTNLSVGWPITLDQLDDTDDSGDIFVCYRPAGICSSNGDSGGFLRAGRSQEQIVTVTSISGRGPYTVGISPGLYMPNWSPGKIPQAWWSTKPLRASGLEDLSIDGTKSGAMEGVEFFNCNGCWVSGVRSIGPTRSHVMAWQSPHSTVQDNYFYRTANQSSSSYALEFNNASDSLVQNNISEQCTAALVLNGTCSGCVLSYNFDINDIYDSGGGNYTFQQQGYYPHVAGDDYILAEGNQGAGLYSDNFHGTHHFQTAFRNLWNGFQPNNGNKTKNGFGAVRVDAFSRFYNIVANVIGASIFTNYQLNLANSSKVTPNSAIEQIGIGRGVPNDPNVSRTIMNWGNYDTVSGVRFCGSSSDTGWATTCAKTSEVPSGIANFANPIPTMGDSVAGQPPMPASFYLSSRPGWWPATKPWPPIGPDVRGGNVPGYAGHAYSIPAADCYANVMHGPPDGTGTVLSFNANSCYGKSGKPANGQTTSVNPPTTPTELRAIAN
jgi:hypothetical protein